MTTFLNSLERIIDKLYNNFLFRDLVYIISGFLILLVIMLCENLIGKFDKPADWLKLLVVFFSYYIGLINQELMIILGIFQMYPRQQNVKFTTLEKDSIIILIKLMNAENLQDNSIKRLDRIITLKNILTSFGSAMLTATLVFSYYLVTDEKKIVTTIGVELNTCLLIIFCSLLFIFSSILSSRRKSKVQDEIIRELYRTSNL